MPNDPAPAVLDLLVVGGLTVDRFADGSSAPGGAVVHVTRAAAPRGLRIGVVTVAGPEPEAQAGLADLRAMAAGVEAAAGVATATFRHREAPDGRRLWLEVAGGSVPVDAAARERLLAHAILYAPVGGEIRTPALRVWDRLWRRGAILQGWLRGGAVGDEVRPVPLAALPAELVEELRDFDLLVASREDLRAEATDPVHQLAALRACFGRRPSMVVTDGGAGAWVSAEQSLFPSEPTHVVPAEQVVDAPTVGAGDIFAAFMLAGEWDYLPDRAFLVRKAEAAMQVVAEVLEERGGRRA
jgi:sugar/nucleoside kinase (ribokinase family)